MLYYQAFVLTETKYFTMSMDISFDFNQLFGKLLMQF